MDSKSLMIGDWVGYLPTWKDEDGSIQREGNPNNPIICKVEMLGGGAQLYNGEDYFDVEEIELYPLPLTAEILEENGFESTPAPSEWVWRHNGQEVWLDNEGNNYWANIKNGEFYFEGYIGHTHELQHCLKLVGIDKEIIL